MKANTESCPCCSGQSYKGCCQPLHESVLTASSAEQLMRSRYSAFCVGNINYLLATLHSDYHTPDDETALQRTIEQTNWLGLKIIQHNPGPETATVEFVAFYSEAPFAQLHELSRFTKADGRWFYTDGEMLPSVKLSRNEDCFCGSAKKYKKCHGKQL